MLTYLEEHGDGGMGLKMDCLSSQTGSPKQTFN